jgi:hypothetical protein
MDEEATHNQISTIVPKTRDFRRQFIAHVEQVPSTLNNGRRMHVANRKAKHFFGHTDFIKGLVLFEGVECSCIHVNCLDIL